MKTILRKVPDEDMYYNFEDEVEIDTSKVVICGNRNYREVGDETLIDIIEGNFRRLSFFLNRSKNAPGRMYIIFFIVYSP